MRTFTLSYYPDITQYQTPSDMKRAVEGFAAAVSTSYSKKVGEATQIKVLPVMSVSEQTQAMIEGTCSIGLMKPVSYVFAKMKNPALTPAAVAWREINGVEADTYLGQLYANRRSGVKTIEQITKRHRIAYGDAFSTSNFLIPAAELLSQGVHPFTGFRQVTFFGGHDNACRAVYLNDADIGAGHDGVIDLLAQVPGYADAHEQLTQIAAVRIYSDPVVINSKLIPNSSVMTEALAEVSAVPDILKNIQLFWGNVTRLAQAEDQRYSSIREALVALSLAQKDVL
ncbi:phosphate/phosphite/phosphonate ABC transporter substrate-binding protein [Hymenobacter sp. BT559]|uniref:phosphate/phosphite/phosphonate ABC transporter substrate-binding protein n=1 Tax=Hymenobacter sp. BT559 TaxID=2795729 RepID=UPI0018EB3195|nr:PhnD/SsuA/transferrin family substrate-binding protein [Hymenobacter sp. BT559]MBJ6146287.1 PhnD/SsuA/transferrin family substrate-binding protein [Hymenobacter sp. BT559]